MGVDMESIKRDRDDGGRFAAKSDEERRVRSVRATDETWDKFGEMAESKGMTRADLLEAIAEEGEDSDEDSESALDSDTLDEVAELLREALTLKPNAGGAIKVKIREALELMGEDWDTS